jgi:hypothetical protein
MTYLEICQGAMRDCHENPTTNTVLLAVVKGWANRVYRNVWSKFYRKDPTFGRAKSTLTTIASYTTGTVSVTNGSATITGTDTVWTEAMEGRKFKLTSSAEVYDVLTYTSPTELILSQAVTADTDSELSYTIYQDELSLPSGCGEIVSISEPVNYITLEKIGLRQLREKQMACYSAENYISFDNPSYFSLLSDSTIVVYPAPSEIIHLTLDYTAKFTELSDDDDEPLIPADFHEIILIGTREKIHRYKDDFEAAVSDIAEYGSMLSDLLAVSSLKTDFLSINPKVYRQ